MATHTYTVDKQLSLIDYPVGYQVSFKDGLPTVDDGLAFYISQLANLESKVYEAKYTAINYQELIPINTEIAEWADTWNYTSYDGVTLGKFIGSNAQDLPDSAINATLSTVPLGYAGNKYSYSLDELRKAQAVRIPLDATKARLSYRGAMEHSQKVAYFGDSERGFNGFFNNPNIPVSSSTVDWSTASGQEIVADMNSPLIEVWVDSANTHIPNVLVMDSNRFSRITSLRMDTGTDTTVYEFFMKNNLYTSVTGMPLTIKPRLQLTAAELAKNGVSNGNKDRMVAYELNPDNLSIANPIPWRTLAPQYNGLNINVPAEYKISGTEFRFIGSAKYKDMV